MTQPTIAEAGRGGRWIVTAAIRGAGLAAFVTGVYVAVVVVAGSLVGSEEPRTGLMLVATAIIALGIGPVSGLMQRAANRAVFGHRLSPEQAVNRLSAAICAVGDPDAALQSLAETICGGTGADFVDVHLRVGTALVAMAAARSRGAEDGMWDQPPSDFVVPIVHGGQELGTVRVTGDVLRPTERRLIDDLVGNRAVWMRLGDGWRHVPNVYAMAADDDEHYTRLVAELNALKYQ
jgi:hypothetical protein